MKNTNQIEFSEEDFDMLLNPEATKLSFKSKMKVKWSLIKVELKLKFASLIGLVKQTKESPKFIEDLLLEEEIDSQAVLNGKFKHPIKHWVSVQLWFAINILQLKLAEFKFFIRNFFNKDK